MCLCSNHDFAGDGIEMCGEAAEYNCFSVTVTISFVAYVFIMFKQDRPQGCSQGFNGSADGKNVERGDNSNVSASK